MGYVSNDRGHYLSKMAVKDRIDRAREERREMPPNDLPGDPTANGHGHRNGNGHVTVLVEGYHHAPTAHAPTAVAEPVAEPTAQPATRPQRVDFFSTRPSGPSTTARTAPAEPGGQAFTGFTRSGQRAGAVARPQPRRLPGRVATLSILIIAVTLIAAAVTAVNQSTDTGLVAAQTGPAIRQDAVRHWNAITVQAIRDGGSAPTVAARALAIVHTSMYDAWAAYDETAVGTQLGDQLRRPESERNVANKQAAISYAAFRALTDLYPDQARQLQAELRHLGYDPANESTDPATAAGIGNTAAAAVLQTRHHDGANQLGDLAPGAYADYTGYQPANSPDTVRNAGSWQPQRLPGGDGEPVVQRFVTPHWSNVAPFALESPDQFRPPGPAPLGGGELRRAVNETLRLSAELDDHDKAVVEYWNGDGTKTAAVQWSQFAQWTSQRDKDGIDQDVKTFFAMSSALLDASIAAWDALTAYDSARPVTVVAELLGNARVEAWAGPYQASRWIAASDWRPYQPATVVSPPYAGYPSVMSVMSAAGAAVLRLCTKSDQFGASATVRSGSSSVEPGVVPHQDVVLEWRTFTEAAQQAGSSQQLSGAAFADANADGLAAGRRVGEQAFSKAMTLFEGTAPTDAA